MTGNPTGCTLPNDGLLFFSCRRFRTFGGREVIFWRTFSCPSLPEIVRFCFLGVVVLFCPPPPPLFEQHSNKHFWWSDWSNRGGFHKSVVLTDEKVPKLYLSIC
ncbi:hypothetical protein JTE90_028149 [Oedothorax gibbosus]|uniref:Uncharacterized protein n=1 Tax=Oedothorax gibbosus TaxID=931172 RepID=A0AAV6V8S5_9ARAC|nr:hypothetical protein JTE90_028149 [Oedothorax gibbosus]